MKTLFDFNFNNKKALIRVDFNVPLDEKFNVTDANRIEAAKPTIDKILADGGSVILMSHLGRPKGVQDEFSLRHIVVKISEVLGVPVQFASDCIGEIAEKAANNLKAGEVLLLENLRFYKEEVSLSVSISIYSISISSFESVSNVLSLNGVFVEFFLSILFSTELAIIVISPFTLTL